MQLTLATWRIPTSKSNTQSKRHGVLSTLFEKINNANQQFIDSLAKALDYLYWHVDALSTEDIQKVFKTTPDVMWIEAFDALISQENFVYTDTKMYILATMAKDAHNYDLKVHIESYMNKMRRKLGILDKYAAESPKL